MKNLGSLVCDTLTTGTRDLDSAQDPCHTTFVPETPTMNLTTQLNFILTLTENEASVIAQFLDYVCVDKNIIPDEVKKLHNSLVTELMEVR